MKFLGTMIMALTVTLAMGQYRQAQPGYEEYENNYESAARPTHPTPRSYASSAPEAPAAPKPTPVAILKQINRHNEDGSYTYGFEGADGSFKIETKQANGVVSGKYGYVDDSGKVRVVEYGADQYGFQPAGEGITVAPPTLVDESETKEELQNQNLDYQEYQQSSRPAQPQQRPIPQIAPAQARQSYRPVQPAPQQQQQQQQRQYQNEVPLSRPVFAPAAPQQLPQSQVLRSQQQQQQQSEYEQAPIPQNYNQGPVQFNPAPVRELSAAPAPQARAATSAVGSGGRILDQLARDYALPQGGSAPLHDISFGYY